MTNLPRAVHWSAALIVSAILTACGGGGSATLPEQLLSGGGSSSSGIPSTFSTSTTTTTTTTTSLPIGATVTSLQIESTGTGAQTNVPLTFGQVFAVGNVTANESITGKLADGTPLGIQVDVKARHADNSVRHAIISTTLPQLAAGQTQTINLVKTVAYTAPPTGSELAVLLNSGFTASVNVTIAGVAYSVSADALLNAGTSTTWLAGSNVNEWIVSAPLKRTVGGAEHPHLTARFAVRSYGGQNKAKIDVIIENGWAYEPNPQDFTYDVQVLVGGQAVYSKNALTHYHHARWRKSFWWGTTTPQAHVKHNAAFLIASKAVPNYDQTVVVSQSALASLKTSFDASANGPMGNGIAMAYMPTTGGRIDIGLVPGWGAMTILSMDKRAKEVTLGMGDLSGSWSTHYRDKITGRPISLGDYPYMTLYPASNDSLNPVGNRQEALPNCTLACGNTNTADTAHLPAFNYVPYLLTGDHYYLEEMQFYTMWAAGTGVPAYREYGKGLAHSNQIRAQSWILRDIANAAYILPDADPMKTHLTTILAHNFAWYDTNYTNNAGANIFGALIHSYAFSYNSESGIAPWQDDFFTSAIGHAVERGYSAGAPLLAWKSKFAVGRMTEPGYCWVLGSIYAFNMRSSNVSPLYTTYSEAYQASTSLALRATACGSNAMASVLALETGTTMTAGAMVEFPTSPTGGPAIMQPALAYAKNAGIANASTAWDTFNQRQLKADYSTQPQFAIIPR